MINNSEKSSILRSKTISKRKKESLIRQLEEVPIFWKKKFMNDEWQLFVTDKMPEEYGGACVEYYTDGDDKQIWINVGVPTVLDNIIFKAIACYAYIEYGNIRYSDTFNQLIRNEEKEIKLFMTFRGFLQYDETQIFIEMFSFVIETAGNNAIKKLSSLYLYLKRWVNGEIFNINYSQIPNYIEIGKDVIDGQAESIKHAFLMLPIKLQKKFIDDGWKIRLSNEKLGENLIYGIYSNIDRKILVRSSSSNIKLITWHEFGHYLDYQENLVSNSSFFKEVYYSERTNLKKVYGLVVNYNYAISCAEEYFAEVFANYMNDSDTFSIIAPNSTQFIRKIIEKWS